MSEAQEVERLSTRAPRRKLTPEQRIAEREAEIERIKERQKQKVRDLIEDALDILRDAAARADALGMTAESSALNLSINYLDIGK